MKFTPPILILAASLFVSGCATNEPSPSPAMREWARQQIVEKQRHEAAQSAAIKENAELRRSGFENAKEVARLKAEVKRLQEANERAKAETEKRRVEDPVEARKQAEAVAWVLANKQEVTAELTKAYTSNKQAILDAYQLEGRALYYVVDDVALDGKILYFSQLILAQKWDGSGHLVRIFVGQSIETNQYVFDKVIGAKDLTKQELIAMTSGDQPGNVGAATTTQPSSIWAPTNETVNAGYRAALMVAVPAIMNGIIEMLSSK